MEKIDDHPKKQEIPRGSDEDRWKSYDDPKNQRRTIKFTNTAGSIVSVNQKLVKVILERDRNGKLRNFKEVWDPV